MTTASRTMKAGWWRLLLAAIAAALVALLSAGPATAATPPVAETRVGASAPATAYVVGVHESVSAGQRWGNAPPQAETVAGSCVAANGAGNAANGVRLGQQLARESAESAFTSSGRLSSGAIADSSEIISGSRLGNKDLIARLTSDGSDIADWGKYTTRTHQSPSGDFQVHFYMNRSTGAIDYGYDYKVVFNGAR